MIILHQEMIKMLKRFAILMSAAIITLSGFAITEAATSDTNNQNNNYCHRNCYDDNYACNDGSDNGYCYDNGCRRGRNCW